MSRPSAKNAVTARICVLYSDFSGRSDSRFWVFRIAGVSNAKWDENGGSSTATQQPTTNVHHGRRGVWTGASVVDVPSVHGGKSGRRTQGCGHWLYSARGSLECPGHWTPVEGGRVAQALQQGSVRGSAAATGGSEATSLNYGLVSRVNYICRLASISFAGSPPWPGPVGGEAA